MSIVMKVAIAYAIGYVICFILSMLAFYFMGKEEKEHPEIYGEHDYTNFLTEWFPPVGISLLISLGWVVALLCYGGFVIVDFIGKKYPDLMGGLYDDYKGD